MQRVCDDHRDAKAPTTAFIDLVRSHPGYDRNSIEIKSGQLANINVTWRAPPPYPRSKSQKVTLRGGAGLLGGIHGADEHTAYNGPTVFKPAYSVLLELRQVQDFEGTVQWGIGLSKSARYGIFTLASPHRLVIDIQT
jgi:hypothetical protein